MPNTGDELHHFGCNACSSALCPYAPHPHVERRYLVVPGLRSSRIHILDTKADPRAPKIVKVIEPAEVHNRAGYFRPHTLHCGPEDIYVSALGAPNGDGPGGNFMLDHDAFDVLGRWEVDRGPQYFAYDFAWHLGHDVQITSEWGTPNMIENGLVPELLLNSKYGHQLHVWDLRRRKHLQAIDLGNEQQLILELRQARDPTKMYGFVGVVISLKDLSASVWLWHRPNGQWAVKKVIEIPAQSLPSPSSSRRCCRASSGRRVYFTNGLYRAWDSQFYPAGIKGWMVKCDVTPNGGLKLDPDFLLPAEDGYRTHQIRLEGGDSSSDTFCYP